MSASRPKVSGRFLEGYGDFALQSGDEVVCYFPRHILSHVFPVFRDMSDIKNYSDQQRNLYRSRSRASHLDPNVLTPHTDPETIGGLMIIRGFEHEILMQRTKNDQNHSSRLIPHLLV